MSSLPTSPASPVSSTMGSMKDKATEIFWRAALSDCDAAPFPSLPISLGHPVADESMQREIPLPAGSFFDITTPASICAAWALVASHTANSKDVVFGLTISGIDVMGAPLLSPVPLRIQHIAVAKQTVSEHLCHVQRQITDLMAVEAIDLDEIADISLDCQRACGFQTLLDIASYDEAGPGKVRCDGGQCRQRNAYPLVLQIRLGSGRIRVMASFDSRVITSWMVNKMLERLEFIITQFSADPGRVLSETETLTADDLNEIWRWNRTVPQPIERFVHEMIAERVQSQPEAQAVCAWDGDLTYGELDRLATQVAYKLVDMGIGPDEFVPVCFEKSMWTSVALLGVLKASAAVLLLDPALPEQRLKDMIAKVNATVIVSSTSCSALSSRLVPQTVSIEPRFFDEPVKSDCELHVRPFSPSSALYAIFTSGSTGTPKGAVMSHRNFASAFRYQQDALAYTNETRVYDFSSPSFDAAVFDPLFVFLSGGCLCVPAEQDRANRLAESIVSLRANYLELTPTVARLLTPEDVPAVKTLVLAGEMVHLRDIEPWWNRAKVLNVYGPAECTATATVNRAPSNPEAAAACIGFGEGHVTWIVDPDDYDRLAPPGCVGELLLEGPLVGDGYLDDPDKTAAAFVRDPVWLTRGGPEAPARQGRLYKTGDLVHYNSDGSLTFVGRKDAQAKIRGQRVELGEIEFRIKQCVPGTKQAVAELIEFQGKRTNPVVAAFLQMNESFDVSLDNSNSALASILPIGTDVKDGLSTYLPLYMIPTVFFLVNDMPMTFSGKVNRKRIREIGATFSLQQIVDAQTSTRAPKRRPTSWVEEQIRDVWARILGVEQIALGLDDGFVRLGGDSVAAIRVVSSLRKMGIEVSVANVLGHSTLESVARDAFWIEQSAITNQSIEPFSLLDSSYDINSLIRDVSAEYQLDSTSILDAYPCTPLQEGLFSLSVKKRGDYVSQNVLEISPDVDIAKFCRAWETVAREMTILRTRIVQHNAIGLFQVVMNEEIDWIKATGLDHYLASDQSQTMEMGHALSRYALISDESGNCRWFVWSLHHCLYDGWSLWLLLKAVYDVYSGCPVQDVPHFGHFIRYIKNKDRAQVVDYWRETLSGAEYTQYPSLPATARGPTIDAFLSHKFPAPQSRRANITTSTLIHAAWALVSGCATNSEDVVFGITVSGRKSPVAGIDEMTSPTIATVPLRVKIPDQSVYQYLDAVRSQEIDLIPFEHTGLHEIAKISTDCQRACMFQTLIVVQPQDEPLKHILGTWQGNGPQEQLNTYALLVEFELDEGQITAKARFDSTAIALRDVQRLIERLEHVMQQLNGASPTEMVRQIDTKTLKDVQEIWRANEAVPLLVDRCAHEVIAERVHIQPDALAVHAWDGKLTHRELDKLSTKLAHYLVRSYDMNSNSFIPICHEKSMWVVVAMLGVLKAGGAIALLDTSLPQQRLRTIVGQLEARLILSSSANENLSSQLAEETLVLDAQLLSKLGGNDDPPLPLVGPSSAAFVVFTSGTTGVPKGATMTHQNLASLFRHVSGPTRISEKTRAYDFASQSFDAAVFYPFLTLANGGCVCIPSDDDRKSNLTGSIASLRVNHLMLTPSVARLLSPDEVPDVEVLLLVGESVHIRDVEPWWGKVEIVNAYGPAECTGLSVICNPKTIEAAVDIGKGSGATAWVVDPNNHNCLVAPGFIGELLIEGPLVGHGYLNDAQRTADAFIHSPDWLLHGSPSVRGRSGRLYKTGDLVRYKDGNLYFVCRKDAQAKINGQRLELGEVEHYVQRCIPRVMDVATEILELQGDHSTPVLAAFVKLSNDESGNLDPTEATVFPITEETENQLAQHLPKYMIPTVFFSVHKIPQTATGKIDRRKLREIGSKFTMKQVVEALPVHGSKRQPATWAERQLQAIWSQVLDIAIADIGAEEDFFRLGGDSIIAMRAVREARKGGLQISVQDLFRYPKLHQLATRVVDKEDGEREQRDVPSSETILPFSLFASDYDVPSLLRDLSLRHRLPPTTAIQDAYACTPLQESLFALTSKRPGGYIAQFTLELAPDIRTRDFCQAWELVVKAYPILRTRIVQHTSALCLLQIVLDEEISWIRSDDGLQEYRQQDRDRSMDLGEPLTRFALVQHGSQEKRWFVWTIHHALYDNWSLNLIWNSIDRILGGGVADAVVKEPISFSTFVKRIAHGENDDAKEYWQQTLSHCANVVFPKLPSSTFEPRTDDKLEYYIPQPKTQPLGVARSTLIQAAWAYVLSRETGSRDVVFGMVMSGRSTPVTGIDDIVGPTIATVPFRVRIGEDGTVSEYLDAIRRQTADMMPFEQVGLQNIAKLSPDCQRACAFQTILNILPESVDLYRNAFYQQLEADDNDEEAGFSSHALALDIQLLKDGITATAHFDSRTISPWAVRKLLERLKFVMSQLEDQMPAKAMADIGLMTRHDLEEVWQWNKSVPQPITKPLVHDIISDWAQKDSERTAVCAWDGELTYGELERFSTSLASELVKLGVGLGVHVPLCFEKSMWATVAIMAVMKSGGAFLLLDASIPLARLQAVCQQLHATVIVSSISNRNLSLQLVDKVVALGPGSLQDIQETVPLPIISSSSPAYVVFTSGSTGTPKGAVITHQNLASAIHHQSPPLCFSEGTRLFDFASYSFDVAILSPLQALAGGGCICTPSEQDRKDNLANSMKILNANTIDLTPSVCQLLTPEEVPNIQILILSGEMVNPCDVKPWFDKGVRVFNVYGPAECTVTATIGLCSIPEKICIGKGAGLVTWVVDPEDHNCLLPLGYVGELLLEGPLVGLGYLNDPEQTAKAFIEDPAWLAHGAGGESTGRHGRLYKTGDLVQYRSDGTLNFIGRKDAQVKIRGQRIELGEVEFHVRQYMPKAAHVVAEVIIPQGETPSPCLVVFLQLNEDEGKTDNSMFATVFSLDASIQDDLEARLPSYMIPTAYFSMREIPMTPTGKTDRKRLREIGSMFSVQHLADAWTGSKGPKQQPTSPLEEMMQKLWGRVLNIDPESIGIDDGFLQLGGDSITAMQVSTASRSTPVYVRTADILGKKTIRRIVHYLESAQSAQSSKTAPLSHLLAGEQLTKLSPMQQFYFCTQANPTNTSFDQCFLLELQQRVDPQRIVSSFRALVQRHAILRARFSQDDQGFWCQHISDGISGSFSLDIEVHAWSEARSIISNARESLNIQTGPLMAVVLFDDDNAQKLFVSIHHLVIDLVSWRILLRELEDMVVSGADAASPSMDFSTWVALQADYAAQNLHHDSTVTQPALLSYWGMENTANLHKDVIVHDFTVDEGTTSAILGSCNNAFNTRPIELMISALVYSFAKVFVDRPTPPVFCEGHGREVWDTQIDISATVGWFTTMYPVHVSETRGATVIDTVRWVKDYFRKLPKNGWSYFTSRFANPDNARQYVAEFPVEIMFNYEGAYQQLEHPDALFRNSNLPENCDPASFLELQRCSLFDFSLWVENGCLTGSALWHRAMKHHTRIIEWIDAYKSALGQLAMELRDRPCEWTLGDFPLAFSSYEDICEFKDTWLHRLDIQNDDIEDIFPCSPMQEGILMSQAKDEGNYHTQTEIEIRSNKGHLDLIRLQQSWRSVVRRHALLRAVFCDKFPGSDRTMHIILKDPVPSVSCFLPNGILTSRETQKRHSPIDQLFSLQHRLEIRLIDEWTAHLRLEMNHVITDGFSDTILWHDFRTAYHGHVNLHQAVSYRSFIDYLNEQSQEVGLEFWKKQLSDVHPCTFPTSEQKVIADTCSHTHQTVAVPDVNTDKIRDFCRMHEVTIATLVRTAWALVLREHTGSLSPCFGDLTWGRDVPIDEPGTIFGPLIGLLPCRVHLDTSLSVLETLTQVQQYYLDSLPYQHVSLAAIHKLLEFDAQVLFNSIVSFQQGIKSARDCAEDEILVKSLGGYDPTEYDLNLACDDTGDSIELELHFRPTGTTKDEASLIADCVSGAISAIIVADSSRPIKDISVLPKSHLDKIWNWNSSIPESFEECIHDVFARTAEAQPDTIAIDAWDGRFTYGELNRLSAMLARLLITLGVGPELYVPLCFEKSKWTAVGTIAVLKAGGVMMLLDPHLTEHRLQSIVQQLQAPLILSSSLNKELSSRLAQHVVVVDDELFASLDDRHSSSYGRRLPTVSPSSASYVVFTSGSTGVPKGAVLTHRNLSTAWHYQADRLRFTADARIYDFSSNSFDAAVVNILFTLASGGCVCVPSDEDRKDNLVESIVSLRPTAVILTPTVAQLLPPDKIPSVRAVILLGEKVHLKDIQMWWGRVQVLNAYGPAECTAVTSINDTIGSLEEATGIGHCMGLVPWIVDPHNRESLVSLGCIGELLLEGPLVGRGYLGDVGKTAASFISDPSWLLRGAQGHQGRRGRLYATGDLVRYNADGSLLYIGRKDTQIKINGQRVELGEIESHIQQVWPEAGKVVAEVIRPGGEKTRPIVATFIEQEMEQNKVDKGEAVQSPGGSCRVLPIGAFIRDQLTARLPSYMVPTVFLSVPLLPTTASGKMNRKQLREIGSSLSIQQIAEAQSLSKGPRRQPQSQVERQLQAIWGQVLGLESTSIGSDDNFFQLGGDSIAAIRVASDARKAGIQLSVADIFRYSTLRQVAWHGAQINGTDGSENIPPFSLLQNHPSQRAIAKKVSSQYGLDVNAVEDAYPCTPLQEGFFSLSSKTPGDYVYQMVLQLSSDIDVEVFCRSWDVIAAQFTTMRTVIVYDDVHGFLQVVLSQRISWIERKSLHDYILEDRNRPINLGQSLMRFALVRDSLGHTTFVWTAHHAIYDAWCLNLIMDAAWRIYNGEAVEAPPPFTRFIKYLGEQGNSKAHEFWRVSLSGYDSVPYPPLPPSIYEPVTDQEMTYNLILPTKFQSANVTLSALVHAAWAVVVGQLTHEDDIVFGVTVAGRSVPVNGIEEIAGPTIATVPLRIKLAKDQHVAEYLQAVQQATIDMMPFEQTGLQQIRRMSESCRYATMFQTLLVIQPQEADKTATAGFGKWQDGSAGSLNTYALILNLQIKADGIAVTANFDTRVIETWTMTKLLGRLDHVMRQLIDAGPTKRLSELCMATTQDLQDIWQWNKDIPASIERCIPDLIHEKVMEEPDALAIHAWDGQLTYAELDRLAVQLAYHLASEFGAGYGIYVPLCFDKSMWASVAALAVIKTGAAFVLLDPSLPEQRLKMIAQQVEASLVISSTTCKNLASRLSRKTLVLRPELFQQLDTDTVSRAGFDSINPSSPLYIVFTSGSTGTPKGVKISHQNFVSALYYQLPRLGFTRDSRVFDFSSYSFDAAIWSMLFTLASGGCLCVPSEDDRRNRLGESIVSMRTNILFLTPSVAQLLCPEVISQIATLIVGGEAIHSRDIEIWRARTRFIQTYGPSECTPFGLINGDESTTQNASRLGTGAGLVTWVVNPENHNDLLPPGCVGELLLEGPLVGCGYIGDPIKTAAAFIGRPEWLVNDGPSSPGLPSIPRRQGRLYKTGDLVRYNENGSLSFIGRKDEQVKIRGQRVELGEISYSIQKHLPGAIEVVADVIVPQGNNEKPIIAAFVQIDSTTATRTEDAATRTPAELLRVDASVLDKLSAHLPSYMIPDAFFSLGEIPKTSSGKTDRKSLRRIGGLFSLAQIVASHTSGQGTKRQAFTPRERAMQRIIAKTLGINPETIGLDDSFFELGGDSIVAMKMVGEARQAGIEVTVMDIFRNPRLVDLARHAGHGNGKRVMDPEPAVLVDPTTRGELLSDIDYLNIDYSSSDVEDILPVTDFQAHFLLEGETYPPFSYRYFHLHLGLGLDTARFDRGYSIVSQRFAILRAIFPRLQDKFWQVVLQQNERPVEIHPVDSGLEQALQEFCLGDGEQSLPNEPPFKLVLLRHQTQGDRLVIRISHAQYDGVSIPLIVQSLIDAYHEKPLISRPSFSDYLTYAHHQRTDSIAYWKGLLEGSSITKFVSKFRPIETQSLSMPIPINAKAQILLPSVAENITTATLLCASWSIFLALLSGTRDVVFGRTVTGRNASIAGVEDIIGPCANSVPIRANLDQFHTCKDLLIALQEQLIAIGEADSLGWREIIENCTDWPADSQFESEIFHHNFDDEQVFRFADYAGRLEYFENPHYFMNTLSISSAPKGDQLLVEATANTRIMTKEEAEGVVDSLCNIVEALANDLHAPLEFLMNSLPRPLADGA